MGIIITLLMIDLYWYTVGIVSVSIYSSFQVEKQER